MSDNAAEHSPQTETLHRVLAEYMRRRDAGEQIDIESFCSAYPDLADALRSYASGEGLLEALANSRPQAEVESDASRNAETIRPGAARQTDLAPNSMLGRYRIIRRLGEGAMGYVYLAEHAHLGREVALKIPKFTGLEGPDFRQRFTREARAAAQLDHPNICRVYDADEINGTPCIAMEYIPGQPLSRFVGTTEFKDQRRVAEVVSGIAAGLAHAHQQGILHRDLKPGNVLMKGDSIPCVTDFGLARRVDSGDESHLTHEGALLGTPAYMSPEQIEAKVGAVGPAADIYALGTVFYELLTGRTPFQGSVMSVLAQAMRDRPTPLSKVRPDVDSKLSDLCLRMLDKSPDKRPKSMQEVIDALQRWLKESSPETKASQAKAKQAVERLDEMKSKILDLVKRGQFAAATAALEKMLEQKSPAAAEHVAWAREKLAQVKKLPKQLKENIPVLLATAKDSLKRHDYAQAAQLLQDIPQDFRNDEVQKVLDKAIELQDEADLLLADLQECVRKKQYQGIDENLKRFLQLRPGNKFARELHESLQTYSKIPSKQRDYRFDDKGRLLPQSSGSFWDSWLLRGAISFAFFFSLMSWAMVVYLKNGNRTLAVEVDKIWLKEQGGQLTLAVDGKNHTLTGPGFEIKVAFGERGFTVKNGDSVIHNPQSFTIEKQGRQVLRIDATGMQLANATNADDATIGGLQLAKGTFNAKQAHAYRVAWGEKRGTPIERRIALTSDIRLSLNLIPPGEFQMGLNESEINARIAEAGAGEWSTKALRNALPQHLVRITRPFYMGTTEVTQSQWNAVMNIKSGGGDGDIPVTQKSWLDIQDFLLALNSRQANEGLRFVLPTDAQWEFACLAGRRDDGALDLTALRSEAWSSETSEGKVHSVGKLLANPWGLYDMQGNVWEWCADNFAEGYFATSPTDDPSGPPSGSTRILRGGAWSHPAPENRTKFRIAGPPDHRDNDVGFRVAAVIQPKTLHVTVPPAPVLGTIWRSASGHELVWCAPGKFRMGSQVTPPPDANETPVEVTLTHGLWVAKHEVTQEQWKSVMGAEPWKTFQDHKPAPRHAATHLTWTEAREFCKRLTDSERKSGTIPADWEFRLPTEAEWEYFARAGTTTRYSFGNDSKLLSEHAWWRDNADAKGEKYAHEVGKFKPNPWGLHDIHGNVYEWCQDTFTARLPGGTDPLVLEAGKADRVNRGGGWDGRDEKAHTSSNRRWTPEGDRRNNLGLRVVLGKVRVTALASAEAKNWTNLFNGRDLTGWTIYDPGAAVTSDWRVSNGELHRSGNKISDIRTDQVFDDFELEFEWKVGTDANSGVFYRSPLGLKQPSQQALEYQIIDNSYSKSPLPPTDRAGAIYRIAAPLQDVSRAMGNWNQAKIVARGQHIEHWLNGTMIVSMEIDGPAWRNAISSDEKLKSLPEFGKSMRGHIVLQGRPGDVWYRNIRLCRLAPSSANSPTKQANASANVSPSSVPAPAPTRLYVAQHAVDGPRNGRSWQSAYQDLQDALQELRRSKGAVKEVWIADGLYKPNPKGGSRDASYELVGGVAYRGGFKGNETVLSQRKSGLWTTKTRLSGDLNGDDKGYFEKREDNSHRILTVVRQSEPTVIELLRMEHATNTRAGNGKLTSPDCGAGIYIEDSTVTIKECHLHECHTKGLGGGCYATHSNIDCSNSLLNGNRAEGAGAAFYAVQSQAQASHFSGCWLQYGHGSTTGGHVQQQGGILMMNYCRFLEAKMKVGGVIHLSDVQAEFANCLVYHNHSDGHTPGVIATNKSAVTLAHCTFADNTSKRKSSVDLWVENGSQAVVWNSILYSGDGTTVGKDSKSSLTARYSCLKGASDGLGVISSAPLFVNSGKTDYRLQPNSPCRDSGSNVAIAVTPKGSDAGEKRFISLQTDIDNKRRKIGSAVDMGAHELQQ